MQLSTNALKRTKDTRSQRGLHKEERWQNMQHAFAARHNIVRNKTIVLVDDVHTSGATMQAAAAALLEAEAAFVAGICIAEAPLYKQLSGYESTSAKQGCLPSTLFLKPAQPFL
jgi:predicted amidophosphoribosyltransferase